MILSLKHPISYLRAVRWRWANVLTREEREILVAGCAGVAGWAGFVLTYWRLRRAR